LFVGGEVEVIHLLLIGLVGGGIGKLDEDGVLILLVHQLEMN
jgi:hypothetical protein